MTDFCFFFIANITERILFWLDLVVFFFGTWAHIILFWAETILTLFLFLAHLEQTQSAAFLLTLWPCLTSEAFQLWRYCNSADWSWKKHDFSIALRGKARFEPIYVHFSGCPAKQNHGRSDQRKIGLTGPAQLLWFVAFVHLLFSFRSFDLLCRFTLVCEGHFVLCYKEKTDQFLSRVSHLPSYVFNFLRNNVSETP